MSKKLKTLLSIAGSDPIGGAGIQADILTGVSQGVHVLTAITSLTVQNSKGLYQVNPVKPEILKSQIKAINEDVIPDAIKIGMVGSQENMRVISDFLSGLPIKLPVVVDPVLKVTANGKSTCDETSEKDLIDLYIREIFPKVTVATPNFRELQKFADIKKPGEICNKNILQDLNLRNLIITGYDKNEETLSDYLITGSQSIVEEHEKIISTNLHGTGCVYSSLLAIFLATTDSIVEAFKNTNTRIKQIINNSIDYQLGSSVYGPLNINSFKL